MNFAEKLAEKIKVTGDALFHQQMSGTVTAEFPVKVDNRTFKELIDRTSLDTASKLLLRAEHFFTKKPVELTVARNTFGGESVKMSIHGWSVTMNQQEENSLKKTIPSSVSDYINENIAAKEHETADKLFSDVQFFKDSAKQTSYGVEIEFEPNDEARKILDSRIGADLSEEVTKGKFILTISNAGVPSVTKASTFVKDGMVQHTLAAVRLNREEANYLRNEAVSYAKSISPEKKEPVQEKSGTERAYLARQRTAEKTEPDAGRSQKNVDR